MTKKQITVGIIGSRGIPSKYGGFETFTEYLSIALAENNYCVFVSCERSEDQNFSNYKGVNLFYFPLKPPKSGFLRIIYEFLYDAYSLFWTSKKTDVILMLGYSASFLFFIPKIGGKRLIVNPDGLEWKRSKFSRFIKFMLKLSERVMVFWTNEIVADSLGIKNYLDYKYDLNCYFVPYGATEHPLIYWDIKRLPEKINFIKPDDYWLVVARLEPENNIIMIIKGYLKSSSKKPLIIVGDFSSENYRLEVEKLVSNDIEQKILFVGSVYNKKLLLMLRQHCFAYVHGHSVGGTNPSLLEAMISRNAILAHKNEFNQEVCDQFAYYFKDSDDFKNKVQLMESRSLSHIKTEIYNRAKENYSWKEVFIKYLKIIRM
ncbi:MAG: DUF1972 domain-containing protein [Methanobacterium sp.]|jgi:rhamnosyltransferase|nr:DUF1972 domain-containing protein [Methanobacterium sp.]